MRFSKIITHVRPHLDEIVAIRLLKQFGDREMPGIRDAVVEYVSSGINPEGKTWQEHRAEGTILVGVGGGPFDEHPTFDEERKEGQSACLLVAKALKVDTHPIYKRLVELVTEADQKGVQEFHIANRLKTRYRLYPENPEKAIRMISEILDDWEKEQRLFVDARRELQIMENNKGIQSVPLTDGENIKLAVIESDNYKMSAAARSLRIAILIQQKKNGHIQISCDTDRHTLSMKKVAAMIRKAECLISGMPEDAIEKIDEAIFERQGKIKEAWNWFYQIPGENLLNGAESAPDTPPTKIPLAIIVDIVKKYIIIPSSFQPFGGRQ